MINPKELRIGNLVLHYGEVKHVSGTNYLGLIRLEQILEVSENAIEPIPLTVQWMTKLGFDWNAKDKRYYIQIGNTLYLEYDTDFDVFIAPESWAGSCPWSTVKHVHQLQNLYFALTGEELTIKE